MKKFMSLMAAVPILAMLAVALDAKPAAAHHDNFLLLNAEVGFEVMTDLKPESNPNCFARKSGGLASVAFFSYVEFDAPGEIDQAYITFAGADVVRCAIEDAFMEGPTGEFSQDGLLDVVCKFKKKEMNLPATGEDCAELLAEGVLLDGTEWTGSDLYCLAGEATCNAGEPIPLDDLAENGG